MCPPDSRPRSNVFLALARIVSIFFLLTNAISFPSPLTAQNIPDSKSTRERLHESSQWHAVEQHLPNRLTSTPEVLEAEGDILRARRLPDDAMDYYNFAFQNGGDAARLLNKLGLVAIEIQDVPWARAYFQSVVRIDRQSADGWNNLGTTEFLSGRPAYAVADYSRAVKLDPNRPAFHCNLAAALFQQDDFYNARKEMAAALKLDPQAFERANEVSGAATQVFPSEGRGRLSFEMARLYAKSGAEEQMLHALAMSSEAGFDVLHGIHHDAVLARYASDPRVAVLVHNAQSLRAARVDTRNSTVSSMRTEVAIKPLQEAEPD
jgi:tetratricopeptide (TPR) repeat protein